MTRPKIGFALGSGSARGWAHIGIIEALAEAGIEPDIVCGTSIGALVGAAHVAGRLTELRQWTEKASWREIFGLVDVRLSGGGLLEGRHVIAFLRRLGINDPIESYERSFAAVATDLHTGREVWLQSGPILDAIRASVAIPGIVSPAHIDGRWLVDGGLCNPVPVSLCRALGAEIIIAVNLNGDLLGRRFQAAQSEHDDAGTFRPQGESLGRMLGDLPATLRDHVAQITQRLLPQGPSSPGYFDVLANSINIMQDHITRARLAGEPPHVLLAPRLGEIGLMEFSRAAEAIAEGRDCVAQALTAIRRFL